jgi:hypothetical protein
MDDTVDLFPPVIPVKSLTPDYPTTVRDYNPTTPNQILRDISIPHDIFEHLLIIGKSHGVPTLQSVLHTASILALHQASRADKPLTIRTSTPISERNTSQGHPKSTGNYVIFHYANTLVDPTASFWDEARRYSTELKHESARINARAALGTFGKLPEKSTRGDAGRSGWDERMDKLVGLSNGKERLAIAVSNVGRMEIPMEGKLVGEVGDVYFAQSASAVGAAIVMSVSTLLV